VRAARRQATSRGNAREPIYRNDDDRRTFLAVLESVVKRYGWLCHAYCLMDNHLVMETPRTNLSRAAGWLQTTYSIRFSGRHRRVGHLFQGRFKAQLTDADEYATTLECYVHLNPVRPRDRQAIIPADRAKALSAYMWSSHLAYAGEGDPAEWLDLSWLRYWGRSKKEAHVAYRQDMASFFGRSVPSPWEALRGGLVLGGSELWEQVRGLMRKKKGDEEIRWRDRVAAEAVRERVRELVAHELDRRVQIWARVKLGGERKVDVAKEFGYGDGSGVLQVVKRLEVSAQQDKALARKLKRLRRGLSSVEGVLPRGQCS